MKLVSNWVGGDAFVEARLVPGFSLESVEGRLTPLGSLGTRVLEDLPGSICFASKGASLASLRSARSVPHLPERACKRFGVTGCLRLPGVRGKWFFTSWRAMPMLVGTPAFP